MSINNNEYSAYYNNYIVIDTNEDVDIEEKYNADIVIGNTGFIIKSEGSKVKFNYIDLFYQNFNKNDVIEILNVDRYIIVIVIITFIVVFFVLTLSTLLDVTVIAIIGLIISGFIGNNSIKFKNAFNIAVRAVTLSEILGMIYFIVNVYTGFYVKYFSTMYTLLAGIYVMTAVLLINTDENNKS